MLILKKVCISLDLGFPFHLWPERPECHPESSDDDHTRRKFGTAAAVRQLVKNRQAPDGADFVVMSEISRNVNLAEIKAPAGAS